MILCDRDRLDARFRWVWAQVHALDREDVILWVLAVLEWVLAGDFQGAIVVRCDIGTPKEGRRSGGDGGGEDRREREGGELHADAADRPLVWLFWSVVVEGRGG